MDCDKRYQSFYEFSKNYLMNKAFSGDDSNNSFRLIVKCFLDRPGDNMTNAALGKRGRYNKSDIKKWCRDILNNKNLKQLSSEEMNYVMGYCARLAKINGANI